MLLNAIDILLRWSKDLQPIRVPDAINMELTIPNEDVSSRQRRDMSIEIGDVGKGTPAECYVKMRAFG